MNRTSRGLFACTGRRFGVLLVASLLVLVAAPATPALAQAGCAPALSVSPSSGRSGSTVLVSGSDFYERCDGTTFTPMRGIAIEFAQGSRVTTVGVVDARASGQFDVEVGVPGNATPGGARVQARAPGGELVAAAAFQVTGVPATPRPATPRPATPAPSTPTPVVTPVGTPFFGAVETPTVLETPEVTAEPTATPFFAPVQTAEPEETEEPAAEQGSSFSTGAAIAALLLLVLVALAIAVLARRRERPADEYEYDEPGPEDAFLAADATTAERRYEPAQERTFVDAGDETAVLPREVTDEDIDRVDVLDAEDDEEAVPYDQEEYIPVAPGTGELEDDALEDDAFEDDGAGEEELPTSDEEGLESVTFPEDDEEEEEILILDDEDWEPLEIDTELEDEAEPGVEDDDAEAQEEATGEAEEEPSPEPKTRRRSSGTRRAPRRTS